jgi:hypothetical protein
MIECFSRDLVTKYCQGLESTMVHTAPPFFVETLHGHSNRSLPRLPVYMHTQAIVPIFSTLIIYIGLCIPTAPTLTRLRSYEMFKVLLFIRINKSACLRGMLNFRLLRDAFPYRLVRGFLLKERVPYPLQSKVRTPPHHLH